MPEPVLLLDTHVWIWIAEGTPGKLSRLCLENIRTASRETRLLVSAISIWEVANLDVKRRISLSESCIEWVYRGLRDYSIELAELAPEIAIDSTRLPDHFHGDPADRILVATARHRNATLVTADRRILEYSRSRHVRALDASSQAAWQ
jgi:PIN domain nuclease of toxin-antitoxin system